MFFLTRVGHLDFVTSGGQWPFHRGGSNGGGDESTLIERENSVWEVGVIPNLRNGAWTIPSKNGLSDHCDLLHWASLCGGVKR